MSQKMKPSGGRARESVLIGDDRAALEFGIGPDEPVAVRALVVDGVHHALARPRPLVEVVTVGTGHTPASARLTNTTAGCATRYVTHAYDTDSNADRLRIEVVDLVNRLAADVDIERPRDVAAFRFRVTVRNDSDAPVVLLSIATLTLGFLPEGDHLGQWARISGTSDWLGEGRFARVPLRGATFPELVSDRTGQDLRGQHKAVSSGTWSTGSALPVGMLERDGLAVAWQIEHNGPWRADIGEDSGSAYLALSGPTDLDASWMKVLHPGETFTTVPATVTLGRDVPAAIGALTDFRRATRRPLRPTRPIVFNDYMNTLNGDPTTERLLPLVAAAGAAGAEVFCIDAGWYDDGGDWWDSVGLWTPSASRFSGGLDEVFAQIRDAGMVPGLWLEPEVVGVRSPVAQTLPPEAFLSRCGQRIVEHDRYHLDLRHPAARAHLDRAIDRLIADLGVGYFKFDYNIDPGSGTDHAADSAGDGLLEHNRAHLAWLDALLDRYPDLVIEGCSSGAMRADPAMLQRFALQSTSDQQDFSKYPPIAAAAPLSYTPEQAASWAYPQPEMTDEEASFTLVTSLLGSFYLSGHLDRMTASQRARVAEAVAVAKQLRVDIGRSRPHWPLGLAGWRDDVVALGLWTPEADLVSVWCRAPGERPVKLVLPHLAGRQVDVETIFPRDLPAWSARWCAETGTLELTAVGPNRARTLRIVAR